MIDRMTRDGQEAPHRPARTVGPGRRPRLLGLLHQLRPQRRQVPDLVQHAGNGVTAARLDDARYPVADELLVVEAHGLKRYRPSARAKRESEQSGDVVYGAEAARALLAERKR